jgi:hypothetical protein
LREGKYIAQSYTEGLKDIYMSFVEEKKAKARVQGHKKT